MRAFALTGFAALAISLMTPASVWAWSTEQSSTNGAGSSALAEQEDPLKALEDKVNNKNGSQQSGFYISGNAGQQSSSPYGFNSNANVPFVPPSQPGFRGLPQ